MHIEVNAARTLMGRLPHGADLLEALTDLARREGVTHGRLEALGAVSRARVGFYDQARRVYAYVAFNEPLEMLNLTGNISLKDGEPFVHAHVTLARESGAALGGHLAPGTTVFACEFILNVLAGPALERTPDDETGLALWNRPRP